MVDATIRSKSLALYRRIIRESRKLRPDAREYYRQYARSGFVSHSDENDPERIDEIIERVEKDMQWIVKKYTI